MKLAHSKALSGNKLISIGNLNNSIIEEIKRANRGIQQCEHSIERLKENLKLTPDFKRTIRFAIKRMVENKKVFQGNFIKSKKTN